MSSSRWDSPAVFLTEFSHMTGPCIRFATQLTPPGLRLHSSPPLVVVTSDHDRDCTIRGKTAFSSTRIAPCEASAAGAIVGRAISMETPHRGTAGELVFTQLGTGAVCAHLFNIDDLQARGEKRQFAVVVTHPSFECICGRWPLLREFMGHLGDELSDASVAVRSQEYDSCDCSVVEQRRRGVGAELRPIDVLLEKVVAEQFEELVYRTRRARGGGSDNTRSSNNNNNNNNTSGSNSSSSTIPLAAVPTIECSSARSVDSSASTPASGAGAAGSGSAATSPSSPPHRVGALSGSGDGTGSVASGSVVLQLLHQRFETMLAYCFVPQYLFPFESKIGRPAGVAASPLQSPLNVETPSSAGSKAVPQFSTGVAASEGDERPVLVPDEQQQQQQRGAPPPSAPTATAANPDSGDGTTTALRRVVRRLQPVPQLQPHAAPLPGSGHQDTLLVEHLRTAFTRSFRGDEGLFCENMEKMLSALFQGQQILVVPSSPRPRAPALAACNSLAVALALILPETLRQLHLNADAYVELYAGRIVTFSAQFFAVNRIVDHRKFEGDDDEDDEEEDEDEEGDGGGDGGGHSEEVKTQTRGTSCAREAAGTVRQQRHSRADRGDDRSQFVLSELEKEGIVCVFVADPPPPPPPPPSLDPTTAAAVAAAAAASKNESPTGGGSRELPMTTSGAAEPAFLRKRLGPIECVVCCDALIDDLDRASSEVSSRIAEGGALTQDMRLAVDAFGGGGGGLPQRAGKTDGGGGGGGGGGGAARRQRLLGLETLYRELPPTMVARILQQLLMFFHLCPDEQAFEGTLLVEQGFVQLVVAEFIKLGRCYAAAYKPRQARRVARSLVDRDMVEAASMLVPAGSAPKHSSAAESSGPLGFLLDKLLQKFGKSGSGSGSAAGSGSGGRGSGGGGAGGDTARDPSFPTHPHLSSLVPSGGWGDAATGRPRPSASSGDSRGFASGLLSMSRRSSALGGGAIGEEAVADSGESLASLIGVEDGADEALIKALRHVTVVDHAVLMFLACASSLD